MTQYTLAELMKAGLAIPRLHLGVLKDGLYLSDIEKQMHLRGDLQKFDILRDLRHPAFVELVEKRYKLNPTELGIEKIIDEIKDKPKKRRLVINVKENPIWANGFETEYQIEEQNGNGWVRVPCTMPGFIVANNVSERTVKDEIKRTLLFLKRRYLPDLVEKEFAPRKYRIDKIKITNVQEHDCKTTADVQAEIKKDAAGEKYPSAHEYWEKGVSPIVESDAVSNATKRFAITEFIRDLTNTYRYDVGDINLLRVQRVLDTLETMLSENMPLAARYTKLLCDIETDSPNIKNAESVQVKGLTEQLADYKITIQLQDHNHKFYEGKPFVLKLQNAELRIEPKVE